MTEYIKPAIMLDGETYYPQGWMYILGFALGGVKWAIVEASKPEFRQLIQDQIRSERNENLKLRLKSLYKEIIDLENEIY